MKKKYCNIYDVSTINVNLTHWSFSHHNNLMKISSAFVVAGVSDHKTHRLPTCLWSGADHDERSSQQWVGGEGVQLLGTRLWKEAQSLKHRQSKRTVLPGGIATQAKGLYGLQRGSRTLGSLTFHSLTLFVIYLNGKTYACETMCHF